MSLFTSVLVSESFGLSIPFSPAPITGGSIGSSTLSSPLTASGFNAYNSDHKKGHRDIICSPPLDPLDILTGEGRSEAIPGWLSCEAGGESNLVASGMDKVGELDPGEVRRFDAFMPPQRHAPCSKKVRLYV